MATKINNAMPEIQVAKNLFIFPITPSLKNVATLLSRRKKKKNSTRRSLTKKAKSLP
jgi:hypothetical protein